MKAALIAALLALGTATPAAAILSSTPPPKDDPARPAAPQPNTATPPPSNIEEPLPDPGLEAEAQTLMHTLRCVVCQSASIADSGADMAGDMRREVRARLARGETPRMVHDYLVSRYGGWISYKPPLKPATYPLWAAPIVFLVIGGLATRALFRRRPAGPTSGPA